eukprot:scaffold384264_cov20-Prasinocladus_malaysianus.AAC.1
MTYVLRRAQGNPKQQSIMTLLMIACTTDKTMQQAVQTLDKHNNCYFKVQPNQCKAYKAITGNLHLWRCAAYHYHCLR